MSNISKSETADAYYKKMTETPVSRLIVTLGIPTTVSMLISGIYNLADTYFVGTLGESPQAATGILFTLQSIIQAIAFMLGHGSGSFVSAALAEKDIKRASKYVSTAFFTGAVIGMLLSVFGILFLSPFMRILGSTETILPYARDYGLCVLVSCPFMICSLILNNNLRYEGKAFYAMIGLTAGGVLNIFGDFFLIRVFPLGVLGALSAANLRMLSNDVYFQVGLLATIGLSAKNAILIVEFAKELHDNGKDLIAATIEAARMRLRPILMTSLAFLLGILPLAISTGAGAGGQNAIGTGVMGGTFAATALGIFYIPVFFVVVTSVFSFRWKWKKPKRRRTANIVETIPGDSHK